MSSHRPHVLLADDNPLVLMGLRQVLASWVRSVEVADNVESIRHVLVRSTINLLVLGLLSSATRFAGISILQTLRRERPALAIVMRSSVADPHLACCAEALGARGFVGPEARPEELSVAIRQVAAGGTAFPLAPPQQRLLTRRQLEVLQADATGEPHKRSAAALGMSMSALDQHLAAARIRLGANSRAHAIILAAERGLLQIPPETIAGNRGGGGGNLRDFAVSAVVLQRRRWAVRSGRPSFQGNAPCAV